MSEAAWEQQVEDVAARLHRMVLERDATLGAGRLLCVDGRAGAGKTTLGHALVRVSDGDARLLHMDDMYEGWGGLGDVARRIARDLVSPLREGQPGRYQRYDWHREELAEWRSVEPGGLLVLEGVGSGATAYADAITTLVWVEAPRSLRLRRGLDRDGEQVLPEWLAWMDSEDELFAREHTRERADVLVDGTGTSEPAVVFARGRPRGEHRGMVGPG